MAAAYEVKRVTEDQIPDPNGGENLADVFDIVFTIPDHPGEFTVQIPLGGDTVTEAFDAITAKVNEVNAIYAGVSGSPEA